MAFALVVFGVYGSSCKKKKTANKHKECREKFVHVNLTLLAACVALVSFRCDRCSTAQREDVWGELLMSHWALGDCHVALRWLTAACAFMPNVQRSPTSYGHQHEIKQKINWWCAHSLLAGWLAMFQLAVRLKRDLIEREARVHFEKEIWKNKNGARLLLCTFLEHDPSTYKRAVQ